MKRAAFYDNYLNAAPERLAYRIRVFGFLISSWLDNLAYAIERWERYRTLPQCREMRQRAMLDLASLVIVASLVGSFAIMLFLDADLGLALVFFGAVGLAVLRVALSRP